MTFTAFYTFKSNTHEQFRKTSWVEPTEKKQENLMVNKEQISLWIGKKNLAWFMKNKQIKDNFVEF